MHKFSASHFLAALILLFIATPFINRPPWGDVIEAVVVTLVMLSATIAVGGRARSFVVAGVLVAPALAAKWIAHFAPGLLSPYLLAGTALIFLVYVAYQLLRFVLRAPAVSREIVCAAIASYLVLGLIWAFAYLLVAAVGPNSFAMFGSPAPALSTFDAFYFSFITLTTIGYGDITPVAPAARMLAVVEGITGVMYTVTLVSRLVSMYSPSRHAPATSSESEPGA